MVRSSIRRSLRRSLGLRSVSILSGPLLIAIIATAASAAAPPNDICRSLKLKASAKYVTSLLVCASRAALTGSTIDPVCVSKAGTKQSVTFDAADARSVPRCNGLSTTSAIVLQRAAAAAEAMVTVPAQGGICASRVLKAGGKFAGKLLRAWSKFVLKKDALARDAAIEKARTALGAAVAKAETLAGCSQTEQAEPLRIAIEEALETIPACIASDNVCSEIETDAVEDATVVSDAGTEATAQVPVVARVTTPGAGFVMIRVTDVTEDLLDSNDALGRQVNLDAPDATATDPLVLTLLVDASILPEDPLAFGLLRNGVLARGCTGDPGQAVADPCVASRTLLENGDVEVVALSTQASTWIPAAGTCPTSILWTAHADTSSADWKTEIDFGWMGIYHNIDLLDATQVALQISCPGAYPDCGTCTVTGLDPSSRNCRCSDNARTVCDQPNLDDSVHCGGNACWCYLTPPMPEPAYYYGICATRGITAGPTGTWDFASGATSMTLTEQDVFYLSTLREPCPVCAGDTTPNDGERYGTCTGGASNGMRCDSNGDDPVFAPSGGGFSYDCMPSPATALVLLESVRQETTGSLSLPSTELCMDGQSCPCPDMVSPNSCTGYVCVAIADDEGECGAETPLDMFCDGFVEEDGRGIIPCYDDAGCASFDAGTCTMSHARRCFAAPLLASGIADPGAPQTVTTYCAPGSPVGAFNEITGVPGPVRIRTDWSVTYR